MKKLLYIASFSLLGVLVGFLAHALIEWPLIFLLDRNFERYSLGFNWSQWFVIHNVGTALLLFAGGLFGLSQGLLWWRILYIEKRRFGHHAQAIVLDFDHTLFNTSLYIKALQEMLIKEFKIAPSIFLQQRNAIKACCEVSDLDQLLDALPYPNKKELREAYYQFIEDRAPEFIFSDARYFMEHHRAQADIILLTHGDKELQAEKIKSSNLPKATKIIITKSSKEEVLADLLEDYQKIHFIDDRVTSVDQAKALFSNVIAYLVVRSEDRLPNRPSSAGEYSNHVVPGLNFEIDS